MRFVLALLSVMLLAACAEGASPGAPGSLTARLNGQAEFFAGAGSATK